MTNRASTRWAAFGAAIAVTLGLTGLGASQLTAANPIAAGDKPVFVPISPCRLLDTRPEAAFNVGPRKTPFGAQETYVVDVTDPTTRCAGRLPADASALSLNVTADRTSRLTFVTIWDGGTRPTASSLNPKPGPPTPNAVVTKLLNGDFRIYNEAGTTDLIVDVNGYYLDHHHDDRYYTQDEVDALLAQQMLAPPTVEFLTYGSGLTVPVDGVVRTVGTFTKQRNDSIIRLTWTTTVQQGAAGDCILYLAVDGQPSLSTATPPSPVSPAVFWRGGFIPDFGSNDIMIHGVSLTDYFRTLSAGQHTISIVSRNSASNACTENAGGYTRTVTVEELPS